jgi:Sulfotransferase family
MTRILFLGGLGRSGTTVLARLLGGLPGVCSVGEVVNLWRQGLLENERCGCGEAFRRCQFWRRVGAVAFGGWHTIDAQRVLALKSLLDRNAPLLAASRPPSALRRGLEEYQGFYLRLYGAVAEVSGCAVIADASKHASLALCLRHCDDLEMRVLHMVRDSRGVAYSWTKRVPRPEATRAGSVMDRFSPVHSAMLWNAYNLGFELLARLRVPTLLVRYEDLVRSPAAMLRQVAAFAGVPGGDEMLSFLHGSSAELTTTHLVAGNPMRFDTGRLALREDDAWRSRFPARQRAVVWALTLPLLLRYGYVVRSGKS